MHAKVRDKLLRQIVRALSHFIAKILHRISDEKFRQLQIGSIFLQIPKFRFDISAPLSLSSAKLL
jgi:dolichol kinase